MFSKLVVVHRVNDRACEPARLESALPHDLLRELSKRAAVFLCGPGGNLQGAFSLGIIWGQQNAAIGFHRQHAVAGLETESISHVLGKGGTDRTASLTKSHLFGHDGSVAQYLTYNGFRKYSMRRLGVM